MLKERVAAEIKEAFPEMDIVFDGQEADVIATIAPIHESWQPIILCDDGDEVTVFYGEFTHVHYGYFDDETSAEDKARAIAADVVAALWLVFDDKIEAFSRWGGRGGGGLRARGTQGRVSKFFFGVNGTLWSGPREI